MNLPFPLNLISIFTSNRKLLSFSSVLTVMIRISSEGYQALYNNKINARVLIGQSAMVYCAGKPMDKSRVF